MSLPRKRVLQSSLNFKNYFSEEKNLDSPTNYQATKDQDVIKIEGKSFLASFKIVFMSDLKLRSVPHEINIFKEAKV